MVSRSMLTAAGVIAAIALGSPSIVAAQQTTRVSLAHDGAEIAGHNNRGAVSSNGRYLAFSSDATNVVPGDTNSTIDVFWRDIVTGQVRRVSVNDAGEQANDRSFAGGVSKDGRLVLFWSHATNLVPGDWNGQSDVFMHDLTTRKTTRLNVGVDGTESNSWSSSPVMSEDGRWVAFESWSSNLVQDDFNDKMDIFLLDRRTGTVTRAGQPAVGESNSWSETPSISPNGRYVAFESAASNIVPGDANGADDAFMYDRVRGTTVRASVADDETPGNWDSWVPLVSDNGRYVSFTSRATNLVNGDHNGIADAFVRDLRRGTTTRVSVDSNGVEGNAHSNRGPVDASGRFVVFASSASNLVANDGNDRFDAFVHDLERHTTVRVSPAHDGGEIDGHVWGVWFVNGRTLLVSSNATNLVTGDANAAEDLFLLRWR
jgi:Tol biopolymer transport system component